MTTDVHKIVVLNPKGGSGKSTLATNLAGYFATQDRKPTLMDLDAQGSSMRWLSKRKPEQPFIHGVAGFERRAGMTRTFAMRAHHDSDVLIVDTPGAVEPQRLPELTRDAQTILVPVLPSDIDIHAATRCISDLLLVAKIKRAENRIGVIANRVRRNTVMYRSLMKFLYSLQIPVVATLRDSQVYVRAFDHGVSLFEMKPYMVREDLEQWMPLIGWITRRELAVLDAQAQQSVLDLAIPDFPEGLTTAAQNTTPGMATSPRLTPYPAPRTGSILDRQKNKVAPAAQEQVPPLLNPLFKS